MIATHITTIDMIFNQLNGFETVMFMPNLDNVSDHT